MHGSEGSCAKVSFRIVLDAWFVGMGDWGDLSIDISSDLACRRDISVAGLSDDSILCRRPPRSWKSKPTKQMSKILALNLNKDI